MHTKQQQKDSKNLRTWVVYKKIIYFHQYQQLNVTQLDIARGKKFIEIHP